MEVKIDKQNAKNICIICQKKFTRRSAMYKHLREIHKVEVEFAGRNNSFKCPDPTCSLSFMLSERLRDHIEIAHGVKIELCNKRFSNFEEFEKWKGAVQKKLNSLYVSRQAKKSIGRNQYYYYVCHRSGFYNPTSAGKRKSSSKKINGWCPSGMDVAVLHKQGVQVKFWKTHFGHTCEIDRLHLSRQEKLEIANKLKEGDSFDKILDDVRDSLMDDDIGRIHLLSRRDMQNILRTFKISNKQNLIHNEAPDVNSWVESMKALGGDCPVIYYKEKGAEHSLLRTTDFLLVLMTKMQQKMLETCTNHIVCLDDIKSSHSFNFHVITLMTVDDFGNGCPLAFCASNRIDKVIVCIFLASVSRRVGIISTNIFMSADTSCFHYAWERIMGPVNCHLLCSWDVDCIWRKKLRRLSCSEEKRIKVYKAMRQIMQEQKLVEFQQRLDNTLKELNDDSDLKSFADYLKASYLERKQLWAFCYRSQDVFRYNVILENIHRGLNECYSEGRTINSFVRTLNLIMGFSRDKLLEKLEKLPKELQINNIGNICQPHEGIIRIDVVKTQEVPEKQLQVPTVEKDFCYVEHNIDKICPLDCKPMCATCCICFHKFTCTCMDNFINLNVCRHIHASVNTMMSQCNHSENKKAKNCKQGISENTEIVSDGDELLVSQEGTIEVTENKGTENKCEESGIVTSADTVIFDDKEVGFTIDFEEIDTESSLLKNQCSNSENERIEKNVVPEITVATSVNIDMPLSGAAIIKLTKSAEIEKKCKEPEIIMIDSISFEDGEMDSNSSAQESDIESVQSLLEQYDHFESKRTKRKESAQSTESAFIGDGMSVSKKVIDMKQVKETKKVYEEPKTVTVMSTLSYDKGMDISNYEECDIESPKSLLLKKINYIHHLVKNRTFNSEEYKTFNERLDKIIEISK